MASDDEDVPESGAVFTFGKTRFADNLASKFWIRDDPVVHISCGDEHSTVVTAKGKLYSFGSNDWGQLGHGNTKPYNKPSVVKKLKPEKSYLVACGRNHTVVATESGRLYSFGCGGDGQLGHGDSEDSHEPKAIESLANQRYSRLACGSDFSAAVTEDGVLYTWGCSSEGQNGLGEDSESPKRLHINGKVVSVACGYYHMAVVTDDGSLYTCGESEGGKLGLEKSQLDNTSQLQKVDSIKEKVISVSCGSEFTVAVTQNGHVYSFGQGNQGQLGLGSALSECELPEKVQAFDKVKAKSVECGESFTAIITKHGNLYTFGDGRHGKLGLGDECFSNLFKPQKVTRFNNFIVRKISCGGCHMLVSAVKKEESIDESDSEEQAEKERLMATMKKEHLLDAVDGPNDFSSTWSARDKRRQKNVEDINNSLSHSLPPINKSSLPPLNGTLKRTLPALGKSNLNSEEKKPVNPLNISRIPKITHTDDEEDNQSTPKSQSSPKPLPRGLAKPAPLAAPRALPRTNKEKEETESDEESESEEESGEDNEKSRKKGKESIKKTEKSRKEVKKQDKESEEDESEGEESETEEDEGEKKGSKPIAIKRNRAAKEPVRAEDDDDDEDSEEEDDDDETEDEDDDKNKKKTKGKTWSEKDKKNEVKSSEKKMKKESEEEEEEEEESEEDKDTKKKKKRNYKEDDKDKKNKKNKKKSKEDDKHTEENKDNEGTEESTKKTKKIKKKGKKKEESEEEEEEEGEEEDKDKEQESKEKTDENIKDDDNKNKESGTSKNVAKQKDKKSGICVLL